MRNVRFTHQFKKDYKTVCKRGYDIASFKQAIKLLCDGEELPSSYKDHPLSCNWQGYRDLHIHRDWILIYRIIEDSNTVELVRTGTHSDLFNK